MSNKQQLSLSFKDKLELANVYNDPDIKGCYRIMYTIGGVTLPLNKQVFSNYYQAYRVLLAMEDKDYNKRRRIVVKHGDKYRATAFNKGNRIPLGAYNTEEEARQAYVKHMNQRWATSQEDKYYGTQA